MVGSSDFGKVGVWMREQKNTMQSHVSGVKLRQSMWMLNSCVSSLRQSPCGQTKAKTSTAQPILDHTQQRLSELRSKLMTCKPEGDDDHSMRETNSMYKILITFKSQNIFAIGKTCFGHEQADNV